MKIMLLSTMFLFTFGTSFAPLQAANKPVSFSTFKKALLKRKTKVLRTIFENNTPIEITDALLEAASPFSLFGARSSKHKSCTAVCLGRGSIVYPEGSGVENQEGLILKSDATIILYNEKTEECTTSTSHADITVTINQECAVLVNQLDREATSTNTTWFDGTQLTSSEAVISTLLVAKNNNDPGFFDVASPFAFVNMFTTLPDPALMAKIATGLPVRIPTLFVTDNTGTLFISEMCTFIGIGSVMRYGKELASGPLFLANSSKNLVIYHRPSNCFVSGPARGVSTHLALTAAQFAQQAVKAGAAEEEPAMVTALEESA